MLDFHITHIGTATAIIELENLTILTDPYFSPPGTEWKGASGASLISSYQPALQLQDLPPIDVVLLSHEDHKDNLDDLGRQLLNGRRVITTVEGAKKLGPRPGLIGLEPWASTTVQGTGNLQYKITATPCEHLPGGQCIGFVISGAHLGARNNLQRALYCSGDTVYSQELSKIADKFDVSVAILNLGKATVPSASGGELQITMDGEQAVNLVQELEPNIVIPMHFEGWNHFREGRQGIEKAFNNPAVNGKLRILEPGHRTRIAIE